MNQPANEPNYMIAIARAKRRFPDHQVDAAYPIGWPVYTVRLALTVLARHEISAVARFILRLADLGAAEPSEFSRMLGLPAKFIAGAAAELLSGELAQQRPDLKLEITDKGRKALKDGGMSLSPKREYVPVPFDSITRQVLDIDPDQLIYSDAAEKNGLFVIPSDNGKPRTSELRIEAIRKYVRPESGINDADITDVAEINARDARLRYRQDIIAIKLTPTGGGPPAFAVFRGPEYPEYMETETIALQRLADSGIEIVPEDFAPSPVAPWTPSRNATPAEVTLLSEIQKADLAVSEAQLSAIEVQYAPPDARTLEDNEKEDNEKLARQLAEKERQLKEQTNGEVRLIKTEEHRPLLLNAIDQSQTELTLVSAWIGPDAFDRELCNKLRRAMERGVEVRIAWGLGTGRGPEAARNLNKGNAALETLTRSIPQKLRPQLKVERTETHEKFIICDNRFCVSGSFNWLSYRGEKDRGYRRETSFYSERPADIALWKANADQLFR